MDDWLKVVVPVLLTGIGAMIFNLYSDVSELHATLLGNKEYIYRIQQNEIKIDKLEKRCK
ncbi:MAG: hypothetical protein DRQ58_09285 [Gammaproteobacteria bacterium]|nr:MAG: hypothetical protein DRQ58_09285 [Gammaproteobacteria bacterium]